MPIDAQRFRDAMARVAAPISVVTTVDKQGRWHGLTASSISSASLNPPLVLLCIGKARRSCSVFVAARTFMVNILGSDDEALATRFASRDVDRFAAGDMRACELNLPGLPGAAARLACTLYAIADAGDHRILIGQVEQVAVGPAQPLVYVDRAMHRLARNEIVAVP